MRKLVLSTLAAGMLAGGAVAGTALASSNHSTATGKTAAAELRTDRSLDRTSVDKHVDRAHSKADLASNDG